MYLCILTSPEISGRVYNYMHQLLTYPQNDSDRYDINDVNDLTKLFA